MTTVFDRMPRSREPVLMKSWRFSLKFRFQGAEEGERATRQAAAPIRSRTEELPFLDMQPEVH